jgi:hypothetical protein
MVIDGAAILIARVVIFAQKLGELSFRSVACGRAGRWTMSETLLEPRDRGMMES